MLLYTCLLWLMTSGLWTIRAQDTNENVSVKGAYRKLATNNIGFAFSLFQHLQSLAPDENIIFSPISISMALSMMVLGAGNQTGTQILQGSGFNHSPIPKADILQSFQQLYQLLRQLDDSLGMSMGNTLFFQQSLKLMDLSSDDLKRYYGLENVAIDFKNWDRGSSQINEYIKEKTRGKISDLLSKLKDPTPLTLLNYIYSTGLWTKPFDPDNTKEENFFVDDKTIVKVPMMTQTSVFNFLYDPILDCTALQLDNVGNRTTLFVLQHGDNKDRLIHELTQDTLIRWSQSIVTSLVEVNVPRLSLSGTYDLGDIMKSMDIIDLKKEQTDLTGITGNAKRKLSKVLHAAQLEIMEQGLKPEVPTNDSMYRNRRPAIIRFDRPFLVMVFDKVSWSILFLGKVINPV
ncbi:corticosteroid-binding globulin-like [Sorex fumeus]|uniref:corticosteroid-binding globulin-like n=1 Tax=Sorex fumeus TaxID=62283 RepID=UPI0024AE7D0E|nr:corticosteroid-binding globulin-like [Sorex fumeus]XP_055989109.1 corticosteroid-binding globulin-like [Sorex fumeus]